ncbi:hypothetical protein [Noviherbaspirillum soli]|uniref:hypothetical protein n=1 Tax=Noviherbaspirillum soli TaxID=1064518 RepID=UPI00188A7C41|nr:hypothetical protein [Noviherbaspirillum soli]
MRITEAELQSPKFYLSLLVLGGIAVAHHTPTFAADVDINIQVPGQYLPAQPVYQQARPVYVQPQPVFVHPKPVYMQRFQESETHCKKSKCKWKKEKKHKHHGHHD